MKKITAIFVAYNPNINELTESIELTIRGGVEDVILVNNSDYKMDINSANCSVINMGGNYGIAKAQSVGMRAAFDTGADFVLQMDQDSKPDAGMVKELLKSYEKLTSKGEKVGLIGPIDIDRDAGTVNDYWWSKWKRFESDFIEVDATLSSGSLIPKNVYEIVGGMFDDLFIDAVDFEYCWRIKAAGFGIYRVPSAILRHRLGEGEKKLFGFKLFRVPKPFRHYYAFRNSIYLMRRSEAPFYWKTSSIVKILVKYFTYWILLDDGFIRFKFMTKGIIHGIQGRLGALK